MSKLCIPDSDYQQNLCLQSGRWDSCKRPDTHFWGIGRRSGRCSRRSGICARFRLAPHGWFHSPESSPQICRPYWDEPGVPGDTDSSHTGCTIQTIWEIGDWHRNRLFQMFVWHSRSCLDETYIDKIRLCGMGWQVCWSKLSSDRWVLQSGSEWAPGDCCRVWSFFFFEICSAVRDKLKHAQDNSLEWPIGIHWAQSRTCFSDRKCLYPQAKREDTVSCRGARKACYRGGISSRGFPGLDRGWQHGRNSRQPHESCKGQLHWECANRKERSSPGGKE